MKIRTTIVCLPVRNLSDTLVFYKEALGFSDAQIDEGIITLDLPNLSLFLMGKDSFETYSRKVSQTARFPGDGAGMIISCAMENKEGVDIALTNAPKHGGTVSGKATIDELSGGYTGYLSDPDGYLWELVYPKETSPRREDRQHSAPPVS